MRSLLTVLGITIGIAAVICVVAIGRAGQAQVERQLNNLGDNFVWIEAGGPCGAVQPGDDVVTSALTTRAIGPGAPGLRR